MSRVLVLSGLVGWVGLTLLLAEVRWFRRTPLAERLSPYVPGAWGRGRAGLLSVESFREALGPLARSLGERVAVLVGVAEPLERRLRRLHAEVDVTSFRVRQLGWAVAATGAGVLLAVALRPTAPVALLLVLGAPVLAFLVEEQRLATANARWRRRLWLELPVVAEQLGMLLGAGWSLFGALDRVARRGQGAVAADLGRVVVRVRQGSTETAALREWAELAEVPAVDRLVAVLALDRETTDLARLIGDEARAIRRDVQRELVEVMARRAQQVWIPVTVATLVPGVLFVAVPFLQAVDLFSAGG
jgi:tight adherence protein C